MEKYVLISTQQLVVRIPVNSIKYIVVEDYVSTVYYADLSTLDLISLSVCKSLKEWEKEIGDSFFKINRNSIIRIDYILEAKKKTRIVKLKNGLELSVSYRNFKGLISLIKQL